MSTIGLRGLRIWIVFLSFTMTIMLLACFISLTADISLFNLSWNSWATISLSFIILFTYIYALKGKPFLHKYLRASLILILSVFFIYLQVAALTLSVRYSDDLVMTFECSGFTFCYLCWAYTFLCTITGYFMIIDIFYTLYVGPMNPETTPELLDGFYYQMEPSNAELVQKMDNL